MKNPDVQWHRMQLGLYASKMYNRDIPIQKLIEAYVPNAELVMRAKFLVDGTAAEHELLYDVKRNILKIDGEVVDAEGFVGLFEKENRINDRILEITGIDHDDYLYFIDYGSNEFQCRIPGTGEVIE